jgi:GABA permease
MMCAGVDRASEGFGVHKVLIVANQTIGSAELTAAVKERMASDLCRFHLLVPVPPTPPSAISVGLAAVESAATAFMVLPDLKALADERLTTGLDWLEALGADATGEVGAIDTVAAVVAVVDRDEIDEILVSTLPSRISKWLRQDLPRKIEKRVSIPVTVVTATTTIDSSVESN